MWPSRTNGPRSGTEFGSGSCCDRRCPPGGASGLRAHVAAFKRLLKPDVCGRLGVVSCERVADLLDLHDEGGLASWVRSRLAATRPVTGRSSTGRHRVVGPGRTPADSSCLAWCRGFGTSARPRSPRQALTQPKAKASGTSRPTPLRRFAGHFERVCADDGVPENRGVPGSSPGLAIAGNTCKLVYLCVAGWATK
jgi:hypothetical protein